MSMKIIAELLTNAPVLLKRYCAFWKLLPIDSGFKSYLCGKSEMVVVSPLKARALPPFIVLDDTNANFYFLAH